MSRFKYNDEIEKYTRAGFQTLDDDQVNKLVSLYIRCKDKYEQDEIVTEATYQLYLDVLDALEGKISPQKLGLKLMNAVAENYRKTVIAEYEDEFYKNSERGDAEEDYVVDFRQRGADLKNLRPLF